MDVTTVSCGSKTRDELAEFRDGHGYSNYDEAICALLENLNADK